VTFDSRIVALAGEGTLDRSALLILRP